MRVGGRPCPPSGGASLPSPGRRRPRPPEDLPTAPFGMANGLPSLPF